jgi:hypothetical protein
VSYCLSVVPCITSNENCVWTLTLELSSKEVHLSLREVFMYVQTISNKRESPSVTSIHDEMVLEYTVNLLRSKVRDLRMEIDKLKNELNGLREPKNIVYRFKCAQNSQHYRPNNCRTGYNIITQDMSFINSSRDKIFWFWKRTVDECTTEESLECRKNYLVKA